jgi:hypothetical protein
MTQISRRRLTTGAAWTVPVIVIGAAAPIAAASGCPQLTVVSAVATRGGVDLELLLSPFVAGYCLSSFTSSGPKALSWPRGDSTCFDTADAVTLRGLGTNSGNDFRGTYSATYVLTGATTCPAQVLSFTAV